MMHFFKPGGTSVSRRPRRRYSRSWKVDHRRIHPQRCSQGEAARQKTPCPALVLQLWRHMHPKRSVQYCSERPLPRRRAASGGAHDQRGSGCVEVARSAPWRRPCQCAAPMRHPCELSIAQAQPPSDLSQESESKAIWTMPRQATRSRVSSLRRGVHHGLP